MTEDYFFRVKASDRGEMRRVLRSINVMQNNPEPGEPDIPKRDGDSWVEVGRIPNWQNPNQWLKEPVSGEAYWHYNMRTEVNIKKRIKDLVASGDPDALILDAEPGRWWSKVTNGDMQPPVIMKSVWL